MTAEPIVWFAEAAVDDVSFARLGRRGEQLIAEWYGVGTLTADRMGTSATFAAIESADPIHRAKIEGGIARLLVRSLRGQIGLHGAAVACRNRALVFLGEAGAGKSTFAAAFLARRGASLLADDAVALEDGAFVIPLERTHFLDDPAARALGLGSTVDSSGKTPIVAREVANYAVPLCAMLWLGFDDRLDEPRLQRVESIDALGMIIPQTVRFAIDEPERNRLEMERLMTLVGTIPSYSLIRSRRFDQLDATLDRLEARLAEDIP